MTSQDYITLKEIILGLRGEYQENERRLRNLESYFLLDSKKCQDFRFLILNRDLYYEYVERKRVLEKLWVRICTQLGVNLLRDSISTTEANIYHYSRFKEENTQPIYLPMVSWKEFFDQVQKIVHSRFVSNIYTNIHISEVGRDSLLKFESDGISFVISDPLSKTIFTHLEYNAYQDIIHIRGIHPTMNVLGTRITKNVLPDYHRLFLTNPPSNTEIYKEGIYPNEITFGIFEKDNLRKLKGKKL